MVFLANRWVSVGTLAVGACANVLGADAPAGPVSWELPDPPRDEDEPYEIVESQEHHCIVLTLDWWMCEDCGTSFPRDTAGGDYPEEAIIEGGGACVAYTEGEV